MTPRPDVSEERKNQIVEAAITVFSRLGFHNARMDDIVEESNLSKGTLYNYFSSKDDIILTILEKMFEREFSDLDWILQQKDSTAMQRLEKMVKYTLADMKSMLKLLPLTFEFYALAFRQKTVRRGLQKYFRRYYELMIPVVQQGVDQGEFKNVDPQDAVIGLGALIEGTALLWIYDPDTVDIDKNGNAALEIFLDGLLKKKD